MERTTPQFTNLMAWITAPPRILILGNGIQAKQLETDLAASGRLDDSMLQAIPPSEWSGYGASLLPLRNVRGVVLIKDGEDEPALVPWRHARVWEWLRLFGRAERQRVRWVIQCSDPDMEEICGIPLAGSGDGGATFGHFKGYTVRSFRASTDEIRAALLSIERTDLVTWEALQRTDKARNALVTLRESLQDEQLDFGLVKAALRVVHDVFDEQPYEIDRFCRPNCHEHGGLWRKWLSSAVDLTVTENVTLIVQSGQALLPLLQL